MRKQIVKGIGGLLLGLLALAVGVVVWYSPGKTRPIVGADGRPKPGSIARLEAVQMNGATQWLLMRGHDSTKPVLLFLHGGPGLPEASLLVGHELEKQFVVVNWEQRGAGKSYDPDVFNDSFTVATFVNDAVGISRWLTRRFHQPRIYLMAHSWGTFLGILAVQKDPGLFQAYFSISQIANQLEAEQISYDWVLAQARRHGASRQVNRLVTQGRPPYPSADWLPYLMWQRGLVADYGGGMYRANFYPLFIRSLLLCREYTLLDKIHYGFGAMKTVQRLWPAVVATDLFRVAPALHVPYYLFQGTHDYQTPYPIARRYFDSVQAPRKRLFTFINSAHSPIFEEPERFRRCLDSALTDLAR
jgi:pimeloyl-ACP methyl ester carboxylesterase